MKPNQTKDKIYQASMRLFLTQGFEDTTLEQITKEAGVAKGTFFNHFPSKDAILTYLCEQMVSSMGHKVKARLNGIESAQSKLVHLFRLLATINENEQQRLKLIAGKLLPFQTDQAQASPYPAFMLELIKEIMEEGRENGEFWHGAHPEHAAHALTGVYLYTTIQWIHGQLAQPLEMALLNRLHVALNGITQQREEFSMEAYEVQQSYDTVIVGGGLAGLSSAALLAKQGKKVLVLERGNLGGRAVTLNIKDFKFNFGAHAIYGRDSSTLRLFEKELGIHIAWRDFNPNKAKYDLGSTLTDIPANILGLFRTRVMKNASKVAFTYEIFKTLIGKEKGSAHMSIKRWMDEKQVSDDVQEMMLTLASSNFFTKEPEKIPSDVFFGYYNRLFTTNKPVAYIEGGWQALIDELVRVIEENGGEIRTKQKVTAVKTEEERVVEVETPDAAYRADRFIFCIPPMELAKVFENTRIEHLLKHYAHYQASYVFVYDIGLKERIDTPYTYVYDKKNKLFITDISYYDETCVPEGGQLLQAIAYLNEEDLGNKEALAETQEKIERLYDKHFAGWREQLVVPRMSKRASAQEIKWRIDQQAMPVFFPDYRNLYFAGDWCQGKGQLSELSFSSAYEACQLVLQNG
ncbi:hypothetical protein XYCOK13_18550 [Xylanibacillus composti]|uniref:HTH tetR-type domain-containing protein n=2 Tax=Xylanibacillus composti TaxID=1572762 RepID=A0A8J4H3U4_9BACL|nr:hypothetical protein XYCOK13_18550 [Xylanibacillus composti]